MERGRPLSHAPQSGRGVLPGAGSPGAAGPSSPSKRGLDLPLQPSRGCAAGKPRSPEIPAPTPRNKLRVPRGSPCTAPRAPGSAHGENFATSGARVPGGSAPARPAPAAPQACGRTAAPPGSHIPGWLRSPSSRTKGAPPRGRPPGPAASAQRSQAAGPGGRAGPAPAPQEGAGSPCAASWRTRSQVPESAARMPRARGVLPEAVRGAPTAGARLTAPWAAAASGRSRAPLPPPGRRPSARAGPRLPRPAGRRAIGDCCTRGIRPRSRSRGDDSHSAAPPPAPSGLRRTRRAPRPGPARAPPPPRPRPLRGAQTRPSASPHCVPGPGHSVHPQHGYSRRNGGRGR